MENNPRQPRPWSDVASSDQFKNLTPDLQERARDLYFQENVLPRVPKGAETRARELFDADTRPVADADPAPSPEQPQQEVMAVDLPSSDDPVSEQKPAGRRHHLLTPAWRDALDRRDGIEREVDPEHRTMGEAVKDLGVSYGVGSGNTVALAGTAYGLLNANMDHPIRRFGERVAEYYQERKSGGLKNREERRAEAVAEAEGEIRKFTTVVSETATDPALLPSFLAEQVPNLAVQGLFGNAVKAAALRAGAKPFTAGALGTGAAVGTGGAMQAADAGGDTFDFIASMSDEQADWAGNEAYQALIAEGVSDEDAREQVNLELARLAAARAGATSIAIQTLFPWARTIERSLVGKPGVSGAQTMLGGSARGLIGESLSNAAEEAAIPFYRNMSVRQLDESQSLSDGTGEAAGMGLMFGAFGAASGASAGYQAGQAGAAQTGRGQRPDLRPTG